MHLTDFFHFQANIDILEANKGSNKEEIRRLRAENKDVRLKLSHLVRGGAHGDEVELFSLNIPPKICPKFRATVVWLTLNRGNFGL